MSAYTDAVTRNLEGLRFVSTGPCPDCAECASSYGFRDVDDEDGNTVQTAVAQFNAAYEAGEVCAEGHFSWSSCDICGSSLGGDRENWHAVLDDGNAQHFDGACTDCVVYLANGDEPEGWGDES